MCATRGFSQPASLIATDTTAAKLIRRSLATAAMAVYMRHIYKYQQWPWKAAGMINPHFTREAREQVQEEFMQACPKCLDMGFCRSLRRRILRRQDLDDPQWVECLAVWCFLIDGDTHDMELWNGWLKQHNVGLSTFHLAAARLVNGQAKAALPPILPGNEQEDDDANGASSSHLCAERSAIQLFHKHCVRRDRAAGLIAPGEWNPVSREYWQRTKAEFAALTDAEKQDYEELIVAHVAAHRNRHEVALVEERREAEAVVAVEPVRTPFSAIQIVSQNTGIGGHAAWPPPLDGIPCPFSQDRFEALLDEETRKFQDSRGASSFRGTCRENTAKLAHRFKYELAGLARARGDIPRRVVHDRPCFGVCSARSHWTVWRAALSLHARVTHVAKSRTAELAELDELTVFLAVQVPL